MFVEIIDKFWVPINELRKLLLAQVKSAPQLITQALPNLYNIWHITHVCST